MDFTYRADNVFTMILLRIREICGAEIKSPIQFIRALAVRLVKTKSDH